MDQTTSSMRPEYSQSGQRCALAFDARNQKAKAKIVTIVGSTIASMIVSESIRMVFSAAPIGPCGSRIFIAVNHRALLPQLVVPVANRINL